MFLSRIPVLLLGVAAALPWMIPARVGGEPAERWEAVEMPLEQEGEGYCWYRCWVKVPDHWTVMTGRPLYRESVTITVPAVEDVHEVFVNAARIGGAGDFPPSFKLPGPGVSRHKVPPGTLLKGEWNEIMIRVYNRDEPGGFPGEAPSIQGYFLECVLAGAWERFQGDGVSLAGPARPERPERAGYDQFAEANRVLGEARDLVSGPRRSPAESLAAMATDDDLSIEELLAEPLVAQPTHLSFDARGRLWVAQYRQYPYPAGLKQVSRDKYYRAKYDRKPEAPPHHNQGRSRISVHEDTDGDGSYDRHKVVLEGLDLANAVLPDHEGFWVMHTPYLLFYPDRDGDDVPDGDPVVHLEGFGFEDTHSVANGLVWGPDGWIYGGQGSTVASRIVRPGVDPEGAAGVYFEGCMAWRYEPVTRRFEVFAEGGGNVFGLEFDSDGRLFSGHNGGGTRGWHYVQGGYLLKQGRTPNKFGPVANPYAFGDLPMMRSATEIVRFSHNTIVCEGTALPTRMRGCFVAADPLHHHLILSERSRRGSTFETRDLGHPLRSEDPAFRPVYLCNAPDGSIFVADFYDFYIAHGQHYQSQIDPTTGRVYRLRGKGQELEADTDLSILPTSELVALLDHPNKWHRQMAVRLLGRRGGEAGLQARLVEWIGAHEGRAALDALWALHQAGGFTPQVARVGLSHPYAPVRAWTVRLLGDPGEVTQGLSASLLELARSEEDPEVWCQLASSMQRLPAEVALPVMGRLLERSGDLQDPYLPLMCWWAIEKHCETGREEVLAMFRNERLWQQAMVRREILPRVMRRFAVTGRESDLLVCAELLRLAPDPEARAALVGGFEQAFAGGALPALPSELIEALGEGGGSLVLQVRQGGEAAVGQALALVKNRQADPAQRLRLVKVFGEVEIPGAEPVLLDLLREEPDHAVRRQALVSLRRYSSPELVEVVLSLHGSLAAELKPVAEALLASRAVWGKAWLEQVEAGRFPKSSISSEALATLRSHPDEDLQRLANELFGSPTKSTRPAVDRIAAVRELVDSGPGNPYRGRPLFRQRCGACHVLFYKGGVVGPDLTGYQRDDLETMLVSILDPNAEIREGYEAYTVQATDGRVLTGFLADQGAKTLTVRGFDGSAVTIPREEVAGTTPLGRSLMPEGLLEGLSDQEIRDLFAYLRSAQPFLSD